jgi:hypothetical protein
VREQALNEAVANVAARVATAAPDELGAILQAGLAGLGPLVDAERAYLVAVDSGSRRVVLADEWCIEGAAPALSTVLSMGPRATEVEIRQRLAGLGVKSVLMVPGRAAGALTVTMFVATSKRKYRPDTDVINALGTVVDAFVDRLVGLRNERAKLAMRDRLGRSSPQLPPTP